MGARRDRTLGESDMKDAELLLRHGRVVVPNPGAKAIDQAALATIIANITHYGFALTHQGFEALAKASAADIEAWWLSLEEALMVVTGDDKNMADHVVYKNFPSEVLAMDEADYWLRQILMYWGVPNDLVREDEAPREAMDEEIQLRVLQLAQEDTLGEIYASLLRLPARWTGGQWEQVSVLAPRLHSVVPAASPFKENLIQLAALLLELGHPPELSTATDVLRLAVAMSEGDVSLRENTKLRSFKRGERRALLTMLEGAANLDEDVARRRERFKRLFRALRPGDWAKRFPRCVAIYDVLYKGAPIPTFESELERCIEAKDPQALVLLAQRPGLFMRRLHHMLLLFGADAAGSFEHVIPKLSTLQLLKTLRHFETDHDRASRVFAPKGNWTKMQTRPQSPERRVPKKVRNALVQKLEAAIAQRVSKVVPTVRLDPRVANVRLQSNDSDLTPYGRGTVFQIPRKVTFLRTASYWESGPTSSNLWYDNGWSFFDSDWTPMGTCTWNKATFRKGTAIFSGDPTNSKDLKGRACQLIDLYLDKLAKEGVRYGVWAILCYSRKSFDEAVDVQAALQWGEKPETGKLFEPSRVQLSFPVRGGNLTKYIAYLDVKKRHLVYVDANLYGRVNSAASNTKVLGKIMPAFLEYVDTLPTVHDLFRHVPQSDDGMCVAYDDRDVQLRDEPAFVFRSVNQDNDFTAFDLSTLL